MSINSSSVLVDGTVATTGGTATTIKTKGNSSGKHTAYLDDASEFVDQINLEFTTVDPKVLSSAPNGYTQQRNSILVKVPLLLDNGSYTMNTIRLEFASDVETTDAERLTMRVLAAQLIHDSDYVEFWDEQSLA